MGHHLAVIGDLEHGRVNDEVTVTYQSFLERMRVLPQMNVGDWARYARLYEFLDACPAFRRLFLRAHHHYHMKPTADAITTAAREEQAEIHYLMKSQLAFILCHELGHFIKDHFRSCSLSNMREGMVAASVPQDTLLELSTLREEEHAAE